MPGVALAKSLDGQHRTFTRAMGFNGFNGILRTGWMKPAVITDIGTQCQPVQLDKQ